MYNVCNSLTSHLGQVDILLKSIYKLKCLSNDNPKVKHCLSI